MKLKPKYLAFSLLSLPLFAHANPMLTTSVKLAEFNETLKAGKTIEGTNSFLVNITAKCDIKTYGKNVSFYVELTKGAGSVNHENHSAPYVVHEYAVNDGQHFDITANNGASIKLKLNEGAGVDSVNAHCKIYADIF